MHLLIHFLAIGGHNMKTQTKQGNRIPIEVMRNQVRKYGDGGVVTETPEERSMRINSSFDDLSNRLTREMGQENETPEERTRRVNEGFPKLVQRLNGSSLPSDNETPVEKPDWEASVQKVLTDAIVGAEKESEVAQRVVSASMLEAAHLKTEAANRAVVEAQLLADQANEKLAQLKQAKAERFNAAHLKTESANKAVTDAQLLANQANEKFAQLKQAKADKTVNSNKTDVEMYNSNGSDINEFAGDPAAEAVHNKFLAGQAEDERLSAIRQAEDAKMMEGLNAKSEASMQKAAAYAESLRGGNPAQPQREAIPALGQQAAPVQPTMPPNSEMTPPQPMPAAQPQEVVAPALGQQAAAQSAAQPSSGAPARAPTPQPAPMTGMQSIMKNYTDKRNALNAQQQKILDDLQLRIDQPSNSWFALAKGFGAPTQTGSFHEAFGKAIGSYSDNQAKTTEQLQALAKMRMELAQAQMKQTGTDASMSLMDEYSRPQGGQVGEVGGGLGGGNRLPFTSNQLVRFMQLDPKLGEDMVKVVNAETGQRTADAPYHNQKPEYYPTSRGMTLMLPIHYEKYVGMTGSGDVAGAEKYLESVTPKLATGASMPTVSGQDAAMLSGLTPQQRIAYLEQHATNQARDQDRQIQLGIAQQNAETARLDREERVRRSQEMMSPQEKLDYQEIVIPAIKAADEAQKFLAQLDQLERISNKAPSGAIESGLAATAGSLIANEANTARRELKTQADSMISSVPRTPGAVSDFETRKMESSLGNLSDVNLSRKQRSDIFIELRQESRRQIERSKRKVDYFEAHRKLPPIDDKSSSSSPQEKADIGGKGKTVTKKFNVIEGPNKGKVLYQYSDGTKEYK